MTTHTTPAEDAARIRNTIKKALGANMRQVSVRARTYSGGSSIDIEIHDPAVDVREVHNIASAAESIRRDEMTGEILAGGNQFLSVKYSDKAAEAYAAAHADEIAALMASAPTVRDEFGPTVIADGKEVAMLLAGNMTLVQLDGEHGRAWVPDEKYRTPARVAAALLSLRGDR